jgi:thiamine pyrophosphokinase
MPAKGHLMDAPSRPDHGRAHRPDVVLVLAAGGNVDPRIAGSLPAFDLVIAADSGLTQAERLGLRADVLVGDLDSVEPDEIVAAAARGTRVERHPVEKDQIDLELALDAACDTGASRVVLVAGAGGRLDMALANLLVAAHPRYERVHIDGWIGPAWFAVGRPNRPVDIHGAPGEVVSVLPVGGAAGGISTEGLRYPLRGETLDAGTTRGVSNELLGTQARISLTDGTVLVVRPDALERS